MTDFRCPICKKPARTSDASFPFCSKRCKLVDLGSWLEGSYRISRPLKEEDFDPEAFGDLPPAPAGEEPKGSGPP